ncbi:FkbM family methyltransferase [Leptospira biflexa]|uniref:FkbM family methyltransferase n=1 Tax=Leptospira biflexa TaxID=172 RepID=UPI001082CF59|nr:FkbM family methyltransferase [Leptospira biflexa]TGM31728.1 FkbM family methyltransferase [Leptospira biflexa]TGM39113.1 FkbM family methyltransferase [Leptospira biflexa]
MFKKINRFLFRAIYFVLVRFTFTRNFTELLLYNYWQRRTTISHNGFKVDFICPNEFTRFRANTFSTKEPETLDWIDLMPKGSILWDIGANVGIYSCYAAIARDCSVFAFEPSVFNLELLARNIFINNLTDKVCIVPIPLNDSISINTLNMTSTDWGGSLSTFGKEYGHDGLKLEKAFEYQLVGVSIDDMVDKLFLPFPDYIKLDVDGIEELILAGGRKVLSKIKGILIEINDDFEKQQKNAELILREAGLQFKEKRNSVTSEESEFKNTYNQIWIR